MNEPKNFQETVTDVLDGLGVLMDGLDGMRKAAPLQWAELLVYAVHEAEQTDAADAARHGSANKAVTCLLGACELLSQARAYLREAVA